MSDDTPPEVEGKRGKSKVVDLAAEAHKRAKKKKPPSGGPTDPPGMKLIRRRGEVVACMANVYEVFRVNPEWKGVLAFDQFAQRVTKVRKPPFEHGAIGEWSDDDDARAAVWIAKQFDFAPTPTVVLQAVEMAARDCKYHPVRDWLRALPSWDGEPRLDHWLTKWAGVGKETPYTKVVGRYFLIGMVARVMWIEKYDPTKDERPGVKFDYCLVLEGFQGKKKSAVLGVLGGQWFGETDLDLHSKDSMSALRGKWLYEFAELGAVTRAESSRQKSFLSRRIDEFRPAFGRREIKCPRQVCFAGTTNEWEWNKDPTGGRRFWPVECVDEIDLAGLQDARAQLFAEALQAYDAGERFWPDQEEQRTLFDIEQLRREQQDAYVDALHDWVFSQEKPFSLADAVMTGLKLDAGKLTRDITTRIGIALKKLGCRKVDKPNGMTRFWYQPPEKPPEPKPARISADDDVPF